MCISHNVHMQVCIHTSTSTHTHSRKYPEKSSTIHYYTTTPYHNIPHPLLWSTIQICLKFIHTLFVLVQTLLLFFIFRHIDENHRQSNYLGSPSTDQRILSWKTNTRPPHIPYQTIPNTCAGNTHTITSTSTKTILRVDRYMKQQMTLTDGSIKKNYLNGNAKKDYINNHTTSKNNTVWEKN